MKIVTRSLVAIAWFILFSVSCSASGTKDDVRALYLRFVTAQNIRNLDEVGAHFIDSPEFLWVSDGKSFWGRKATLERMKGFQEAEVWRVEPDLQGAKVVEVTESTAYLHLALDLVIGAAAKPDRIPFLVSALCVKTAQGWKIAALFTTTAKPG
jgi:hypothetical protein